MAHELVLLNEWIGIANVSTEQLEGAQALLDSFQAVSPLLILAAMAVSPAVFEELFFRGYLFSAFATRLRASSTVMLTAVLFGVFHVVTAGAVGGQRLLPSTFLGLVLGWVCWRTASVLPGIVLHTVHNGLLLMMGYYHEQLEALGWGIQQQSHLPTSWLAASAATIAVGALLVGWGRVAPGAATAPS